jgi:hypothetical protein
MAITFPTVNGNWSNPAIWSGSTLPTINDDVYANNKSIYINQDVTVRSIRTTGSGSAVAGGIFEISSSVTINATGDGIIGGTGTTALNYSGSGTINVYGNISGAPSGQSARGMTINGTGTTNIVGNLFGGLGAQGSGLQISSNAIVNIVGDLYPTTAGNGFGLSITNSGSIVTITGNIYNAANSSPGLNLAGSSSVSITGNCYPYTLGSSTTSNINASTNGSKIVFIGNIFQASPNPTVSPIILTSTSQSIDLTGNVFASLSVPAITVMNTTSTVILRGVNLVNSFQNPGNSIIAVLSPSMTIVPSNQFRWKFYNQPSSSASTTMFIQGYTPDSPSQSDVRFGTTYLNGTLSGSVRMPQPSQVISGVRTDNTTGSYNVTLDSLTEAIWTKLTNTLTGSNTIGERLKNNSTIDSTGQQLQALN